MSAPELQPLLPMPIKAVPYRHQIEAFNFVCALFGLPEGGGALCQKKQPARGEPPF